MCRPASMIVLPGHKVHWSRSSDSHEDQIRELDLDDTTAEPNFVRVEIVPPDGDLRRPLAEWQYRVDQDFRPRWYRAEHGESAVRAALTGWACARLALTGHRTIRGNDHVYALNSATVEALSLIHI